MSHEIINNSIAYTNETPWHGLGVQLPEEQQDLDTWRIAECRKQGMDGARLES